MYFLCIFYYLHKYKIIKKKKEKRNDQHATHKTEHATHNTQYYSISSIFFKKDRIDYRIHGVKLVDDLFLCVSALVNIATSHPMFHFH